jgi:hypothetical protein
VPLRLAAYAARGVRTVLDFGLAVVLVTLPAAAQVQQPHDTQSAGEGAGPMSDVGGPMHDGSAPVHGAPSVGESSGGPVHSRPVRDGDGRSMHSGPVSDISSGPMTEPRPPITSGAMSEASAGAVTHDIDSPLGERISQPVRELEPLRQQMRAQRERAEHAALLAQSAPAVAVEAPPAVHIESGTAASEPVAADEPPLAGESEPARAAGDRPVAAADPSSASGGDIEPQDAADSNPAAAADPGSAPSADETLGGGTGDVRPATQ